MGWIHDSCTVSYETDLSLYRVSIVGHSGCLVARVKSPLQLGVLSCDASGASILVALQSLNAEISHEYIWKHCGSTTAFRAVITCGSEAVGLRNQPGLLVHWDGCWCSDDGHQTKSNEDAANTSQNLFCEGHGFSWWGDLSRTLAASLLSFGIPGHLLVSR